MPENVLAKYVNGNGTITLLKDGTKIREFEGEYTPEFPESIDVKITNYCDAGCPYCHEQSTRSGEDCLITEDRLIEIFTGLAVGTELAIGGGNPLDHFKLSSLLLTWKQMGFVSNMTVNARHICSKHYAQIITGFKKLRAIHGVGISYYAPRHDDLVNIIKLHQWTDVVFHLILGVNTHEELEAIIKDIPNAKILLLGYKNYGRGNEYASRNVVDLSVWYRKIVKYLGKVNIAFDNLAVNQLKLWRFFTDEGWKTVFMGPDGSHTFYIDLVSSTYAVNSSSNERYAMYNKTVKQMFYHIRSLPPNLGVYS